MFTEPMVQLLAVVMEEDADRVAEELLRQGAVHFMDVSELQKPWSGRVPELDLEVSLSRVTETRKRIEDILHSVEIYPENTRKLDLKGRKTVHIDEINTTLDDLSSRIESIRENQRSVQQEIARLEELKRQIDVYPGGLPGIDLDQKYSFITMMTGIVAPQNIKELEHSLKDFPSVVLRLGRKEEGFLVLVLFMKRDQDQIEKILSTAGWKSYQLPPEITDLRGDIGKEITSKIRTLQNKQNELWQKSVDLVKQNTSRLTDMWVQLRINELVYRIKTYFRHTSSTVIFSGWLPRSNQDSVAESLSRITGGRYYLEWHQPAELIKDHNMRENVPAKLRNPRFLAPFQMLVTRYGIPEYGSIDPTPVVMVSYLIMFGLMFADVGHGAVLAVLGAMGSLFFRKKTWLDLSKLIIWCGFSSMVFGGLFGSYFGMSMVAPLWFDFHGIVSGQPHTESFVKNIFDILAISVYFGMAIIGIGLVFSWINSCIQAKWEQLFLGNTGLVGGWIYAGGVYSAYYLVSHSYKQLPGLGELFLLLGLPSVMILFREGFDYYRTQTQSGKKPGLFAPFYILMQWVVELLEVFSRYLSNTLSFLRVAGLGIAHVSLMIAFFELARMANGGAAGPPYSPGYIMVLVCGNLLVIGLEGLSAGVQALRLNYYEFFSKFFHPSGKVYTPVSLAGTD
ncbi:MAG: V-type ATP synthase subunit I [Spirochaetota bacterium]